MPDIVISGISGRFPESVDVTEFWENLTNGVDMVTDDGRRWKPGIMANKSDCYVTSGKRFPA